METRQEKAERLFREGYNCSQSVFAAFSDLYGIDQDTALRLSASFGAGMGRMREVCGAVSGMLMVIGLATGATEGKDAAGKKRNYETVQMAAEEFKKISGGSIVCRELLGLEKGAPTPARPEERTADYYKKRPCLQLIKDAAAILEHCLLEIDNSQKNCTRVDNLEES